MYTPFFEVHGWNKMKNKGKNDEWDKWYDKIRKKSKIKIDKEKVNVLYIIIITCKLFIHVW